MSHPRLVFLRPVFVLIVTLAGSEALAGFGTETYTATTPGSGGLSKTNLSSTLAIPAFNTLNGTRTLESVVISSADFAQLSASLTNNAASASAFSVTHSVNFSFSFNGSTILSDNGNVGETKNFSLSSRQSGSYGVDTLTHSSAPVTIIDPTVLALFNGTGNLSFLFNSSASVTNNGGGGNVFINPTTLAGSTLTVTYNYITPSFVPEPASFAMTALGGLLAGGVGFVRSRKARASKVA